MKTTPPQGCPPPTVIRSMGQTFTTARIQNTAVFLDGIYLQRQSMVNPGLMNLERVEVVKGPQNAQFGRNAFAGVVNYISSQPSEDFSGDVRATYGDGGRLDAIGSLSVPIMEQSLHLRISVGYSEFDGHTDNDHPFANMGPGNEAGTNDKLGGWDDQFFSTTLRWTPNERLEAQLSYYETESLREPQGFYFLDGARYAYDSSEFSGPPFFAFLAPLAANCNNTATFSSRAPFPAVGPHSYCGELPSSPPNLTDPKLLAAGFGDTAGQMIVDPRSVALDSVSKITRFNFSYDLSDTWSLSYQLGYVDHQADNYGAVAGRASLVGSTVPHVPVSLFPFPPFIQQLGPPGSFGAIAHTSVFNANPAESLEATSHEFRLTMTSESLTARIGVYYSETEDDDGSIFFFLPPCNSEANCSVRAPRGPNPLEGKYLAVVPVVPGQVHIGIPHVYETGNRVLGNHTAHEDTITAVFGDVEWQISDQLTLALEARFTSEDQSFNQLSTTFGTPLPGNVATSDDETFDFFTPRAILEWMPTDTNMIYGLVASGVKTGGFNPVDPSANPGQAVYDEEKNITYEIGSKNRFLDNRVTLNAAFYLIDWQDVQGVEAASSRDAWATDVVGNIGDAEVIGFEVDGVLVPTMRFFVDYHLSYSDAQYEDAIYQSSVAGPTSSWGCNNSVCRADGNVDGNQVERTSKWQYGVGLNYLRDFAGGWQLSARLDFNYRSKMYATPLNLAHNGDRTLSNANVNLSNDDWSVTLWGRNIFDEEYVANSFVLPSFTRYIVGLGAKRTVGLTLNYSL